MIHQKIKFNIYQIQVPKTLDFLGKETFTKSLRYSITKNYLSLFQHIFDETISFFMFKFEIFPFLFNTFHTFFTTSSIMPSFLQCSLITESLSLWCLLTLLSFPDIPFDLYAIFVVEQKYGFNKQTLYVWFTDWLKGSTFF